MGKSKLVSVHVLCYCLAVQSNSKSIRSYQQLSFQITCSDWCIHTEYKCQCKLRHSNFLGRSRLGTTYSASWAQKYHVAPALPVFFHFSVRLENYFFATICTDCAIHWSPQVIKGKRFHHFWDDFPCYFDFLLQTETRIQGNFIGFRVPEDGPRWCQ